MPDRNPLKWILSCHDSKQNTASFEIILSKKLYFSSWNSLKNKILKMFVIQSNVVCGGNVICCLTVSLSFQKMGGLNDEIASSVLLLLLISSNNLYNLFDFTKSTIIFKAISHYRVFCYQQNICSQE